MLLSPSLLDRGTEDPFVPKVRCPTGRSDESRHDGDEKGKSKNTQRENTDGPPRLVQMLGAISDRWSTHPRVSRRYARHLLRGRVQVVLASVVAVWSGWKIVVIVVVVLVVLGVE